MFSASAVESVKDKNRQLSGANRKELTENHGSQNDNHGLTFSCFT